jgi:uncharacterized membrane protein
MQVCYLGDDHLAGAAAYLAGIMSHFKLAYDYVPSAEPPPGSFRETRYSLYVISDYPAARFSPDNVAHVRDSVAAGSGLLMIGGWDSFFGRLGEYHQSPLADVLPVTMLDADDRRNCAQPCLVQKAAEHPILAGLPWETPPGIGGYNVLVPKPDSETLLRAVKYSVRARGSSLEFAPNGETPLLVVGSFGQGRTAALATDVAPHWVGGWVDWGDARVFQEVAGGFIEVGAWYARFFRNLLVWLAGATQLESPDQRT